MRVEKGDDFAEISRIDDSKIKILIRVKSIDAEWNIDAQWVLHALNDLGFKIDNTTNENRDV